MGLEALECGVLVKVPSSLSLANSAATLATSSFFFSMAVPTILSTNSDRRDSGNVLKASTPSLTSLISRNSLISLPILRLASSSDISVGLLSPSSSPSLSSPSLSSVPGKGLVRGARLSLGR